MANAAGTSADFGRVIMYNVTIQNFAVYNSQVTRQDLQSAPGPSSRSRSRSPSRFAPGSASGAVPGAAPGSHAVRNHGRALSRNSSDASTVFPGIPRVSRSVTPSSLAGDTRPSTAGSSTLESIEDLEDRFLQLQAERFGAKGPEAGLELEREYLQALREVVGGAPDEAAGPLRRKWRLRSEVDLEEALQPTTNAATNGGEWAPLSAGRELIAERVVLPARTQAIQEGTSAAPALAQNDAVQEGTFTAPELAQSAPLESFFPRRQR